MLLQTVCLGIMFTCSINKLRPPQPLYPMPRVTSGTGSTSTGLDLKQLEMLVCFYFAKGLAPSTIRAYKSAQSRFLQFCQKGHFTPLPLSESLLCSYVSHLADQGLKHSTLKVYLSAVRYLQIASGQGDPFAGVARPRLDYVMRGIKKAEAEKGVTMKPRLPITPSILGRLQVLWSPSSGQYDIQMIWAACCLAFFAFLRAHPLGVAPQEN